MKINYRKIRPMLILGAKTGILSVFFLSLICHSSCRITEQGIQILSGDYTAPSVQSFAVEDSVSIEVNFSEQIEVIKAVVADQQSILSEYGVPDTEKLSAELELSSISVQIAYTEANTSVVFIMDTPSVIGVEYELYAEIKDKNGNTLTFCLPFKGYNDSLPFVILNEIQTCYASGETKSAGAYIRAEYIELFSLTSGCLSGLEIVSASDGEEKKYELPDVWVDAGDYVVVHLRNKEEGCISETGDDLSLSTGTWSCDTARDLWADNTESRLCNKNDIIFLRNSNNDTILDAVMYAESDTTEWKNESMKDFAEKIVSAGIWPESSPSDAACGDYLTATKSLCRQNTIELYDSEQEGVLSTTIIPGSKDDWIVVVSGDTTPGTENSEREYTKK